MSLIAKKSLGQNFLKNSEFFETLILQENLNAF